MNRLRSPFVWLTLALLIAACLGGTLLNQDCCLPLTERERSAYGLLPAWQAGFDALSAACGVGLLTRDLERQYSAGGRWVLLGLGMAGALLYLAAARQALGRLWLIAGLNLPSLRTIFAIFLGLQALLIVLAAVVVLVRGSGMSIADSAWQTVAAFSSLGWTRAAQSCHWVFAAAAFIGALGWPVWLLVPRRTARPSRVLAVVACYAAFLLVGAGLIAALETPRKITHANPTGDRLADQPPATRYARGLVQVTCASAAGMATEQLEDRGVTEGTKAVLAGVVLVGGLGGSAGGGCKLPAVLILLAAGGMCLARGVRGDCSDLARRTLAAAAACVAALVLLAGITAGGLLLIETLTASGYQSPPTLGDALLEAASAVGGANLSTGLTASLSSPNLSSGIRQSVDLYQYGTAWLMLAMLIGRILPLLVLDRVAAQLPDRAPSPTGEPACPYLV